MNVYYLQVRNSVDEIIWNAIQNKLENVGQALDGQDRAMEVTTARTMPEKGEEGRVSKYFFLIIIGLFTINYCVFQPIYHINYLMCAGQMAMDAFVTTQAPGALPPVQQQQRWQQQEGGGGAPSPPAPLQPAMPPPGDKFVANKRALPHGTGMRDDSGQENDPAAVVAAAAKNSGSGGVKRTREDS